MRPRHLGVYVCCKGHVRALSVCALAGGVCERLSLRHRLAPLRRCGFRGKDALRYMGWLHTISQKRAEQTPGLCESLCARGGDCRRRRRPSLRGYARVRSHDPGAPHGKESDDAKLVAFSRCPPLRRWSRHTAQNWPGCSALGDGSGGPGSRAGAGASFACKSGGGMSCCFQLAPVEQSAPGAG